MVNVRCVKWVGRWDGWDVAAKRQSGNIHGRSGPPAHHSRTCGDPWQPAPGPTHRPHRGRVRLASLDAAPPGCRVRFWQSGNWLIATETQQCATASSRRSLRLQQGLGWLRASLKLRAPAEPAVCVMPPACCSCPAWRPARMHHPMQKLPRPAHHPLLTAMHRHMPPAAHQPAQSIHFHSSLQTIRSYCHQPTMCPT